MINMESLIFVVIFIYQEEKKKKEMIYLIFELN